MQRRTPVVTMKTRFLISLLCVGAVAFACGPRARNEATGSSASATTLASVQTVAPQGTARTTRSATAATAKMPLSATFEVRNEGTALRFELEIVNKGKKSIELTFPSGQTHDFVIVDSLNREVWRWATGRLFTQALQNTMLSRGETMTMTETWDAPTLKPGRYTVVAVLKSQNYPVTERAELAIGEARLATRE
jgi:hypothetical protein